MGRKRSTWKSRKADPYRMNQERDLPPVEKYLIGDPSAFAEDVHEDLPDDMALGRNEIGLPNMPASNLNHKDVEEWNSGDAYDNASTFSPEDRDRSETPDVPVDQMNDRKVATQKRSAREVFAALERKAYHCTKIAQALLPGAPQSMIEDQSYELMALPDEFVLATTLRLAADDEDEKDEEKDAAKKAEEEEEERKEKAARLMREARRILAGDDEDEDEDDDDKDEDDDDEDEDEEKDGGKKKSSLSDDRIEAMLREMMDEDDEDEDAEAMLREMMMEEEAGKRHSEDHLDAMDMHGMDHMGEEDPEVDAMLRDMMEHESMGMDMHGMDHRSSTEFDIGMDPRMDVTASEALAGDTTLQNLFNNTIPKEARQEVAPVEETKKTAGVSSLGGRVKEAADTEGDYDLSKLWKHDPDISGTF